MNPDRHFFLWMYHYALFVKEHRIGVPDETLLTDAEMGAMDWWYFQAVGKDRITITQYRDHWKFQDPNGLRCLEAALAMYGEPLTDSFEVPVRLGLVHGE